MIAALQSNVPFEQACGGNSECGTCHVYAPVDELKAIDGDYVEPDDLELDVIDELF